MGGRSSAGRAGVTPESGAAWRPGPQGSEHWEAGLLLSSLPRPYPVSALGPRATVEAAALASCRVRLGLRAALDGLQWSPQGAASPA